MVTQQPTRVIEGHDRHGAAVKVEQFTTDDEAEFPPRRVSVFRVNGKTATDEEVRAAMDSMTAAYTETWGA